VAHEINNPLAFLKSNLHSLKAEFLERPVPGDSEVNEIVSESLEGVSRIETIVQALKGTARKTQEKIRFDPARSTAEAVTIFRGAKKAECEIDCQLAALPEVLGAPSAVGQVVLNLMQNGLDAMSGLDRRSRKLEIRGRSDGDRVYLTVRDHGCGIPIEVQRRMFDAFYTTKDPGKGTGLGLYICKEIIEGMGGQLHFVSGQDGTTFECQLPAALDD
jgi:C4-dicarboxylate-specific signal transduction histidine kinase